ncbi:MAG: heme-copper oxidase subunit III [Gemmatimonadota bacterium]
MSTQTATADFSRAPEPVRREQLIPNGVMGMLMFIFTELMFFGGLISAHTIVRSQVAGQMWPPFGQPRLPVEETAVNTTALMASGFVLLLTWFAFRRDPERARIPLIISIGLGAFFVLFQGAEWVALLGEGLTMTSSTYGGFFYLIVGAHGLHALAALVAMGWMWRRLDRGQLTAHQLATVSAFWYFVVLVWPVLYWRVYL